MSSLESTEQHVARHLELITNWLALLALLGIGIVWVPPGDDRAPPPAAPGVSQHARVDAPQGAPPASNRPQQHVQSQANRACRQS